MRSLEAATVLVTPAPVVTTPPAKHKVMDLDQASYATAAKSLPASKAKPAKKKLAGGSGGYVLEDVPHLTDYLPELKVIPKSFLLFLFGRNVLRS
jgi:6-phosphofructokinase 1